MVALNRFGKGTAQDLAAWDCVFSPWKYETVDRDEVYVDPTVFATVPSTRAYIPRAELMPVCLRHEVGPPPCERAGGCPRRAECKARAQDCRSFREYVIGMKPLPLSMRGSSIKRLKEYIKEYTQ